MQTTGGCKFCLREMRITMLERELQRPAIESPYIQPDLIQSIAIKSETAEIPRLY